MAATNLTAINRQTATPKLSAREISETDVPLIVDYWSSAEPAYLQGMGVDLHKMPAPEKFTDMLQEQLGQSYQEKQSYCMIWETDGKPVGHSNVNRIVFGESAYMHLHIWYARERKMGLGAELIKMTLPYFFNNLHLKKLYCEPYALNPAPNRVLAKAGFEFVKEHITTPGAINFEQPVCLWQISRRKLKL